MSTPDRISHDVNLHPACQLLHTNCVMMMTDYGPSVESYEMSTINGVIIILINQTHPQKNIIMYFLVVLWFGDFVKIALIWN